MAGKREPPVIQSDPWPLRVDADGIIRIGKGRLTLHAVIEAWGAALTPEAIARDFGQQPADIYGAISYYLRHREDLRPYFEQLQSEANEQRLQIQAEQPPFPTRAELEERLSREHAKAGQ